MAKLTKKNRLSQFLQASREISDMDRPCGDRPHTPLQKSRRNLEQVAKMLGVDIQEQAEEQQNVLTVLEERVSRVEDILQHRHQVASVTEVQNAMLAVAKITEAIFGTSKCEIIERDDCDVEGQRYFEFNFVSKDDLDTILKKHDEWHSRVAALPDNVRRLFSLSIDTD